MSDQQAPIRGGYISAPLGGIIGGAAGAGLVLLGAEQFLTGDEVSNGDAFGATFFLMVAILGGAAGLWAGGIAAGLYLEGVGGISETIWWSAGVGGGAMLLLGVLGLPWLAVVAAGAVAPALVRVAVVAREGQPLPSAP